MAGERELGYTDCGRVGHGCLVRRAGTRGEEGEEGSGDRAVHSDLLLSLHARLEDLGRVSRRA